jgi:hypothetical protein
LCRGARKLTLTDAMPTVRKIRKIVRRETRNSEIVLRAAPTVDPRFTVAVWHVYVEGSEPVGPVTADQIARGVRAGKVPSHACVRHSTDLFWSDLLDVPEIVAALKAVSTASEPPPPSASPALAVRQYHVWVEGSDPVGPVSADQIARGIRAGKVPSHASIQRVGEFFASDVLDEPDVIAALKLI